MLNYARKLPRDATGEAMQLYPPTLPAKARYTNENNLVSSVISFSHNTTSIEITTVGAPAVGRWVTRADTAGSVIGIAGATSNYDIAIPANTTRGFVVPIEVQGANMLSSIVGLNREAGLYQRIAIKAQAIGSVLTVEY
jgi:hypothetical protein